VALIFPGFTGVEAFFIPRPASPHVETIHVYLRKLRREKRGEKREESKPVKPSPVSKAEQRGEGLGDYVYIVDYDIPTYRRQLFYYHLRRQLAALVAPYVDDLYDGSGKPPTLDEIFAYAAAHGIFARSTGSVIVTSDEAIAEVVYSIASQFGVANMYAGRKVK